MTESKKTFEERFYKISCVLISWGMGIQNIKIMGLDISKLFPLTAIVCITLWVVKNKKILDINQFWYNLFIVFTVIHILLFYTIIYDDPLTFKYTYIEKEKGLYDYDESIYLMITRYFIFFLYAYAFSKYISKNIIIIKWIANYYYLGLLLSFIMLMGNTIASSHNLQRATGGFLNPNSLGYLAVSGFFITIISIIIQPENKKVVRIYTYISLGLYSFIILISGSRGSWISMIIGLGALLLGQDIKNKIRLIIYVSLLAGMIAILIPEQKKEMIKKRSNIDQMVESGGTGRVKIWKMYLQRYKKYIIYGVSNSKSFTVTTKGQSCHNTYLTLTVEYGIIGLLLFIMAIRSFVLEIVKKNQFCCSKKLNYAILALLASYLTACFSLDTFTARPTWVVLSVVIGYTSYKKRVSKGEKVK